MQLSNLPQDAPAQMQLRKETHPMPVANGLVIEAAQSWNRRSNAPKLGSVAVAAQTEPACRRYADALIPFSLRHLDERAPHAWP